MKGKYLFLITICVLLLKHDLLVSETTDSLSIQKEKYLFFNLINGLSVSYQKKLRESEAFRLGLHINGAKSYSKGHQDAEIIYEDDDSAEDSDSERKRNSFSVSFTAQYLLMKEFNSGITLFGGLGPYLGLGVSKNTSNSSHDSNESSHLDISTSSSRRITVGVLSSFGCMAKITEGFHIYSEYEISIKKWYSTGESEHTSKYDSEDSEPWSQNSVRDSNENGWDFLISDVRIGLAYSF
ncbi:hypothetical protein HQ585_08545 [candidate division KSB1 bacterium]|nr:hypothetical protein [candidate division KSB1 bacterium]